MVNSTLTREAILKLLEEIPDPEIPVINILELGVLRDVQMTGEECTVYITPTYTGCPAMHLISTQIREVLTKQGVEQIVIKTVFAPAWSSENMTAHAKEKLKRYGIAPPTKTVQCPQCNSAEVSIISEFGSTACKALYRCNNCLEPFDYFKCI